MTSPPPAIDPTRIREACEREIERGLLACQVAVGCGGDVAYHEAFGAASEETRFWVASATKPIVAAGIWLLIGEGRLEVERRVAETIPEFAANGKQDVTVEQVLLMTSGFPEAPMSREDAVVPARRVKQMSEWSLIHQPGLEYHYHFGSAHWVLAELIERITGEDFRDFIERRVTTPLGLPRVLGIPREEQRGIAQISDAADEVTRNAVDYAAKIEVGEPGGGGAMRACDLARFYQGLLHDRAGVFDAEVLREATTNIRCTLPDPVMKLPANRTLGVVIGAGFGTTWGKSKTAFGWPGMGGQIAFAEPETGVSFCFLQMGDSDPGRQFMRGIRMSNLALELGRD